MRDFKEYTIMDGKTTTGVGNVIYCEDFTHAIVSFNTSGSANCSVKFAGSIASAAPNFSAAQSPSNSFDYVQLKDLEDASSVDGDTGLTLAGTDDQRLFEVNVNALTYFTANITAISAGAVTIKVKLYTNK